MTLFGLEESRDHLCAIGIPREAECLLWGFIGVVVATARVGLADAAVL
jgi:hypothetical protein